MKRLLFCLLVLCCVQQSVVRAQPPSLTVPGPTNTFPSYAPFNLDLQFTSPPAPCNSKVRAVLRYTSSNPANTGNQVSVTGGTYGQLQLFSNYPTFFNPGFSASTLIVGTQNSSTNMSFSINTKEGVFCNNTTLTFTAKLYYYNASGVLCDSSAISNPAEVIITAENRWKLDNEIVTNASDLCLNLPVKYEIQIDHSAEIQGSYNLMNPVATFTVPPGAEIINVLDPFNTPLPFTLSSNNTVATFNIINLVVLPNNPVSWPYYVIVRFPCQVFQLDSVINVTVSYSGTNPCGTASTKSVTTPIKFTKACCDQVPQGILKKDIIGAGYLYCPGNCKPAHYNIYFDNTGNPYNYPLLTITDNLPAQINCTSIGTQVPQGSTCNLFYRFDNTPAGQWLGPLSFTTSANTATNTLPGWTPGTRLAGVRWEYTNFPAFVYLTNGLDFTINSNVNPGVEVSNTATAISASPVLNASATRKFTVDECIPWFNPKKYVLDANNNCVSFRQVTPGSVVTYRIVLENKGSATLNNGIINDVLNNAFIPDPSSVQYYYGPLECPASNLFTPTLTLPGSTMAVSFNANNQNLQWGNVNVPQNCSGVNYFIVEFKVLVKAGTPSGPYTNQAFVPQPPSMVFTWPSTIATVNVADYLNVTAKMEVACRGGEYVTNLKVRSGEPIRYRITVENKGNFAVHTPTVFNVRPQTGDLDAGCSDNCVQHARNSQFAVNGYTPFSVPAGFTTLRYPQMNCNKIICFAGGNCTDDPLLTNPASIGFRGNSSTILNGGQSFVIEIDGVAGSGTIGQMALNDAGVSATRVDNGETITAVCTNLPVIMLDSVGCLVCQCGRWEYTRWEFLNRINGQPQWQSAAFSCGDELATPLEPSNNYPFYYKYSCNDTACTPSYLVSSDLPAGAYTTSISNGQLTINYNPTTTQCGKHQFTVTPVCGKDTCAPCPVYFTVQCKDTCAEIVSDRISCDSLGYPVYSFCIRNNSTFTANTIKIKLPAGVGISNVVPPAGVTYDGIMAGYHKFTYLGGIPPGSDLCTFQWRFTGVTPGQTVCMGVAIHQGTVPQYPVCCEDTTYRHCVTIPDCSDKCIDVLSPVMYCGHGNIYYLQFKVKNNGLTELDRIVLQRVSPGTPADVFTYTFATPLANGQTSGLITYPLNFSPNPNVTFCYRIRGYDMHIVAGELCVKDSCVGDLFCVKPLPCGKGEGGNNGITAKGQPVTGVAEAAPKAFMVFPNPSNGNITLRYSIAVNEKGVAEIWNLKGQLAKRLPLVTANGQQQEMRLEKLAPGAYLLKVTVNGKTAFSERIVILKQ